MMRNDLRERLWDLWGAIQWYYRWWMGALAAVLLAAALAVWLHFSALERTRGRQLADLSAADSLIMAGATERARAILDSLSPHLIGAVPEVSMRHAVLSLKARDKAYLPLPPPDSLVATFVHHYDRHPDLPPAHRAEAYYYAGRTFSLLGDAPQALSFFQRTLDVLGPDDVSLLRERTHFQMSELFAMRAMDDLAIVHERQALHLAQLLGDTSSVICAYWDLAESFNNHDADSVRYYHNLSLRAAQEAGDSAAYYSALCSMASVALYSGRLNEVEESLLPCLRAWHEGRTIANAILCIASEYYFGIGNEMLAEQYAQLCLAHCNIYGRQAAESVLYKIHHARGEFADAAAHFEAYVALSDSVARQDDRAMLRRMQAAYDYTQRENDVLRLEAVSEHKTHAISLIATSLLALLLLTVTVTLWLRLRARRAEAQRLRTENMLHELRQSNAESTTRLEEAVRSRQVELESMTREREALQARIDSLQLQSDQMQGELDRRRADRLLHDPERQAEKTALASSTLLTDLYQKPRMTRNEDRAIRDFFLEHNPGFIERLETLVVASSDEWRISVLLRLGLPQKNIALLLRKDTRSIHYFRRKLAQQFLREDAKAEDWNGFLETL